MDDELKLNDVMDIFTDDELDSIETLLNIMRQMIIDFCQEYTDDFALMKSSFTRDIICAAFYKLILDEAKENGFTDKEVQQNINALIQVIEFKERDGKD